MLDKKSQFLLLGFAFFLSVTLPSFCDSNWELSQLSSTAMKAILRLCSLTLLASKAFSLPSLQARNNDKGAYYPDLYEATFAELGAGLDAGHFTSADLVKVSS